MRTLVVIKCNKLESNHIQDAYCYLSQMTKDHVHNLHDSESLLPQYSCDCFLNLLVHNALGVARRKAVGLQVPLDLIGESIEDHLQEV